MSSMDAIVIHLQLAQRHVIRIRDRVRNRVTIWYGMV